MLLLFQDIKNRVLEAYDHNDYMNNGNKKRDIRTFSTGSGAVLS